MYIHIFVCYQMLGWEYIDPHLPSFAIICYPLYAISILIHLLGWDFQEKLQNFRRLPVRREWRTRRATICCQRKVGRWKLREVLSDLMGYPLVGSHLANWKIHHEKIMRKNTNSISLAIFKFANLVSLPEGTSGNFDRFFLGGFKLGVA